MPSRARRCASSKIASLTCRGCPLSPPAHRHRDARELVKAAAKARIDESLVVKALVERRRIAEQHIARHLADERLAQEVALVRLALEAD